MGHPIYHLDLQVKTCDVEVRINDFPVATLASKDDVPSWFAPPINPTLVGDLNIVDVVMRPVVSGSGSVSTFFDAEVEGWIRRYEKGDIVAPGEGDVVATIAIPEELVERVREEELSLPQSFSFVFANDTIDFSDELGSAPLFEDREALLDYAMRLRDLLAARDLDGLMTEHAPKIAAWVVAYEEPAQAFEDSLRQELTEFLQESPITDFERDDIELVRCCGGRVWGLERRGGQALFMSEVLPDESVSQIRVFVGARDGQLRVVR